MEPDDFGPKIEEHSNVTVEGEEGGSGGVAIGAEFSYTSPATVSQPAKFAAKVTDPNNRASPHAQYKYVWEFGDGAKAEGSGGREFRAEHVYAIEGRYEVKLEVTDEARPDHGRDARGPGERPADPGEHREPGGRRRRQRQWRRWQAPAAGRRV